MYSWSDSFDFIKTITSIPKLSLQLYIQCHGLRDSISRKAIINPIDVAPPSVTVHTCFQVHALKNVSKNFYRYLQFEIGMHLFTTTTNNIGTGVNNLLYLFLFPVQPTRQFKTYIQRRGCS
jgi:hypothetical protein